MLGSKEYGGIVIRRSVLMINAATTPSVELVRVNMIAKLLLKPLSVCSQANIPGLIR